MAKLSVPDDIRRYQVLLLDNLSLHGIIPRLNEEGLLTRSEQEYLLNDTLRKDTRVMKLTEFLSEKGKTCIPKFLKSLQSSIRDNPGHADLFEVMSKGQDPEPPIEDGAIAGKSSTQGSHSSSVQYDTFSESPGWTQNLGKRHRNAPMIPGGNCHVYAFLQAQDSPHTKRSKYFHCETSPGSQSNGPVSSNERFCDTSTEKFATCYVTDKFNPDTDIVFHTSSYQLPHNSSAKKTDGKESNAEEWTALLKSHWPDFHRLIDIPSLLPQLVALDLLTPGQIEYLNNPLPLNNSKITQLLSDIQRKGCVGFERFLVAIEKEKTHLGHRELYKILTDSEPSTLPPREFLINRLRDIYKEDGWSETHFPGSNLSNDTFINLALIGKCEVNVDSKEGQRFIKETLHGLVDDIEKNSKSPVRVDNIFNYKSKTSARRVLVEGAPGIGKTRLACHLCTEWAKGKFDMYDIVLFVPLRRYQSRVRTRTASQKHPEDLRLVDLLTIYLPLEKARLAAEDIENHGGKNVLLIFEGWDELSPDSRHEYTFFTDVISKSSMIPQVSVLVTSRHVASNQLREDYRFERHIEIIGFNSKQIQNFISVYVPERKDLVRSHLRRFPNLRALCHIPLTLRIICQIMEKARDLPSTLTAIYDLYIRNVLLSSFKKQRNRALNQITCISDLSKLPEEAMLVVKSLTKLAFLGFREEQTVFHCSDLKEVGLCPEGTFDGYGLLSTLFSHVVCGYEVLYQFGHLTIQEYLCAKYIESLDYDEQISLLEQHRLEPRFQVVWKFFAGITKLEKEEVCKAVLSTTKRGNNRDELFLFHCLYEANNPHICQVAARECLKHEARLNNRPLNTTDCLCLSYVIAQAGGEWELKLQGCNMGAEGLEVFRYHLLEQKEVCDTPVVKLALLDLKHNHLHLDPPKGHIAGCEIIANLVTCSIPITELKIDSNTFDRQEFSLLTKALGRNDTIKTLSLAQCKLTPEEANDLAGLLVNNKTLKVLFLRWNHLGDTGVTYLAQALERNQILEKLYIGNNEFGQDGVNSLCRMLQVNQTLKELRLVYTMRSRAKQAEFYGKKSVGIIFCLIEMCKLDVQCCDMIVGLLPWNRSLEYLDMKRSSLGDEGVKTLVDGILANPECALRHLGLFRSDITDRGVQHLCDLIANNLVETLLLGSNSSITDDGARCLSNVLPNSTSVKVIRLDETGVSKEGQALMDQAITKDGIRQVDVTYVPNVHLKRIMDGVGENRLFLKTES